MSVIKNIDLTDQVSTTWVDELNENFNALNDDKLEKPSTYPDWGEILDTDLVLIEREGVIYQTTGLKFKEYANSPTDPWDVIVDIVRWAWENNNSMITMDWNLADQLTPYTKNDVSNIKQVQSSWDHTLVLLSDWTVMSVWANNYWQLGRDTWGAVSTTLAAVEWVTDCVYIACWTSSSFFIMWNGTMKSCWRDLNGNLGGGTFTPGVWPSQLVWVSQAVKVAPWSQHTLVLNSDWSALGTGRNNFGQFWDWGTTNRSTFSSIAWVTNCVDLDAGWLSSYFVIDDWTVKVCWYNVTGSLGLWNTTSPILNLTTNLVTNAESVTSCTQVYVSLYKLNDWTVRIAWDNTFGHYWNWTAPTSGTAIVNPGESNVSKITSNWYNHFLLLDNWTIRVAWRNTKWTAWDWTTNQINTWVDSALGWANTVWVSAPSENWAMWSYQSA